MGHVFQSPFGWSSSGLLSCTCWSCALAQSEPRDPADLAAKVAGDLAAAIKSQVAGSDAARCCLPRREQGCRAVTEATASGAVSLQGGVDHQNSVRCPREIGNTALPRPQLASAFKDKGVDPQGIDSKNTPSTAETLEEVDLDVAVQASFDQAHGGDLSTKKLNLSFKLVFRDKTDKIIPITAPGTVIPPPVVIAPGGPENPAKRPVRGRDPRRWQSAADEAGERAGQGGERGRQRFHASR